MENKIKVKLEVLGKNIKGEIVDLEYLDFKMVTRDQLLFLLDKNIADRVYAFTWFEYQDPIYKKHTGCFKKVNLFNGPVSPNQWFTFSNFLEKYFNLKKVMNQWIKLKASPAEGKKLKKLIKKFESKLSDENKLKLEVYDETDI